MAQRRGGGELIICATAWAGKDVRRVLRTSLKPAFLLHGCECWRGWLAGVFQAAWTAGHTFAQASGRGCRLGATGL